MIRRRIPTLTVFALGASSLGACASAPREVRLPPATALVGADVADSVFAAGATILKGFDLAGSPEDWQIGDQILIGMRVTKPDDDTVRILHVELLDRFNPLPVVSFKASPAGRDVYRFESGLYFTRLSLYDERGALLDTGVGQFPERIMGHGLYDGAEPSMGRVRRADGGIDISGISDEEAEHELLGWLSLFTFSMSMNKKGMFNEMMKDVVARPSLLTMLLKPSVSLGMGKDDQIERQAWTPRGTTPIDAVTVPLVCAISDKIGAVARVHAARPIAPLGLSGGIVSIVGNNAAKPDIQFEIRLLACKRGTRGRAFLSATEDPVP